MTTNLTQKLHGAVERVIESIGHMEGEGMYSAIRPSPVYILGYNPGNGGPGSTIAQHLPQSLTRSDNAWCDERWKAGREYTILQKRMHSAMQRAGIGLRSTPSSNLIFATSPDASKVDYKLADDCWPFHLAAMNIIRPRVLLVFGNGEEQSTWAYIRDRYPGAVGKPLVGPTSQTKTKVMETLIGKHLVNVVGIPHPSRWEVSDSAVEKLRELLTVDQ